MHTTPARSRGRRTRLGLAMLALLLAVVSTGESVAVMRPTMFRDSFDELGPLKGTAPSDPYEIKRGEWEVVDLPDLLTFGNPRRVVRQNSTAGTTPNSSTGTGKEPVVFIRDSSFRALSVQVTAALIAPIPGSSVGVVFRAPILEDQSADQDNLYLFSAENTGFVPGFPTGKAFVLWKRIGQGYYMLSDKVVHTWADLTKPHTYKVTMDSGHIRAFVDGNLIIEHTDVPSGDKPSDLDKFPGLPYHAGSVGLRTSNTRGWFDDLVVVADDAYEGRATALDAYYSYPFPLDARQGSAATLSQELDNHGLRELFDTGFVYSDAPFDRFVVKNYEDGKTQLGASLRTRAFDGMTESTAQVLRARAELQDLTSRISLVIDAARIDATVTASCEATTSEVHFADTSVAIMLSNGDGTPDTVIGPFNIDSTYQPNSVIYNQPGVFQLIAHRRIKSSKPQWIQASALSLLLPHEALALDQVNVGGNRVVPSTALGASPGLVVDIGRAVAGRYCAPMVETDT